MLRSANWRIGVGRSLTKNGVSSVHRSIRRVSSKSGDDKHAADNRSEPSSEQRELQKRSNPEKGLFQVKSQSSRSAPAPISEDVSKLMKDSNKPYVPKLKHERLTYEYPGLPNEDDFVKHSNKVKTPKVITRWSRYVPKILTGIVAAWTVYVVKVWYFDEDDNSDSTELLSPTHFHKFIVTHKQQIDKDHYLIEVKPKFHNWQYSYYAHYTSKTIWNGDKLWSVEIMQPSIMVVRSYTPLPLYFMKSEKTRSGEKEPLLRVVENDNDSCDRGGVMTFYIKRYENGELSRYITDKCVGDELDIRGPHVEYKFPHHPLKQYHQRPIFRDLPSKVEAETLLDGLKKENNIPDFDNLDFFAAGTGIAPALQLLFTRNPYRGFVTLHYSAQSESESTPFNRFLFFLEKLDRVKVCRHFDTNPESMLSIKNIKPPAKSNYLSPMRKELSEEDGQAEDSKSLLALRTAVLSGEMDEPKGNSDLPRKTPWYENALEQARVTGLQKKSDASLALVCGPDAYVDFVAGEKKLDTNEQGSVKGLLAAKGWDETNVYKL